MPSTYNTTSTLMHTCHGICVCLIMSFAALLMSKSMHMGYNSTVSDDVLTIVNLCDAAKLLEGSAIWPLWQYKVINMSKYNTLTC